jgi:hypothetical protein
VGDLKINKNKILSPSDSSFKKEQKNSRLYFDGGIL